MDEGGFFLNTAEPPGLFEGFVVNVQRRSHMHEYARFMQTSQAPPVAGGPGAGGGHGPDDGSATPQRTPLSYRNSEPSGSPSQAVCDWSQ